MLEHRYIIRRLLLAIPTWVSLSSLVFVLMRILPGDVALAMLGTEGSIIDPDMLESVRRSLGLDQPLHVQYLNWFTRMLHLDLGKSFVTGQSVTSLIARALGPTVDLALMAVVIAVAMGVTAGILSAVYQDTLIDYVVRIVTILGLAIPSFWLGIVVMLSLLLVFRWSVPIRYVSPLANPWQNLQKMIWPAFIVGYVQASLIARITRSSMLDVMCADYVCTARSKGLPERSVVLGHMLKNAALPVVTIAGFVAAHTLMGVVVMEVVFNIPGMGRLIVDGIRRRDYPVVEGSLLLVATVVVLVNLLVDLTYGWLDPQVRHVSEE